MRNVFLMSGLALAFSTLGQAAPCAVGSFASYLALGPGGCSVNDQNFSGFTSLPNTLGTTTVAPSAITVTPITTQFAPGFLFAVNESVGVGGSSDVMVGFNVTPVTGGARLGGGILTQNGGIATGDGGVAGIATFCFDGALTATGGCPTTYSSRNLGTYALSGLPPVTMDSLTFAVTHGLLGVTGDFLSTGGSTGSASVTSFGIQVQDTPEPATVGVTALALAGLGLLRLKSRAGVGK